MTKRQGSTVAALDLGTNTIKLTVARCRGDGGADEVYSAAEVVRIGKAIRQDGTIAAEAIDRAMGALIGFEHAAREHGTDAFFGVATEALRIARNGAELLARVAAETSWELRVITGDEEARLTFEGLRQELPEPGTGMIVDIGGGSTELILTRDQVWLAAESHPVGSGALTDRYISSDPPALDHVRLARDRADAVLERTRLDRTTEVDQLLVAGGAGMFIDALSRDLLREPLSLTSLPNLVEPLTTLPASIVANRLSIPVERARVLPAGHQIAMSTIALFRPAAVRAVPSGIRAGLIARWCAEHA